MNKSWIRLIATESMSTPLALHRNPAVLGQFYFVFWRLPDPIGHNPQFFRSSSFSVSFWTGFLLAELKGLVSGNYTVEGGTVQSIVQDCTFATGSLELLTSQVESVTLRCYPCKIFPLWSEHKTRLWCPFKIHTWMRKCNFETAPWKNPADIFALTLSNKWKRNTILSK